MTTVPTSPIAGMTAEVCIGSIEELIPTQELALPLSPAIPSSAIGIIRPRRCICCRASCGRMLEEQVELGLDCLRRYLQGLPVTERTDFERV